MRVNIDHDKLLKEAVKKVYDAFTVDDREYIEYQDNIAHKAAKFLLENRNISHLGVSPSMLADVEDYVKDVKEYVRYYNEIKHSDDRTNNFKCELFVEKLVPLSPIGLDGKTLIDAIIKGDDTLHVFNFDYKSKIKIEIANNTRLKLFALAAFHSLDDNSSIDSITIHVNQPFHKKNYCKEWWSFLLKDLVEWHEHLKSNKLEIFSEE